MWNVSSSVLLKLSAPRRVACGDVGGLSYQEESQGQRVVGELLAPSRLRA